jgi:GNAT superfamily N-acetyltransferase
MPQLDVREATEADLPAILNVYAQPELDDSRVLSLEEARAQWRRIHAHPDYKLYVAVRDGAVIGTFALLIMPNISHLGASAGIVDQVGVLREHQGQGVGKLMMEHARQICRRAGCYKMMLSSNLKRQQAHAFYESLGFEKHGFSFKIHP